MFVRQVKRKCSVRGCKNTDCYAISRSREMGNTVIICKSCIGKALGVIDEIDPVTKTNIPVVGKTSAPPLFFNAQAMDKKDVDNDETVSGLLPVGKTSADDDTETREPADGMVGNADLEQYICPKCGRAFDTERGLKVHMKTCKG